MKRAKKTCTVEGCDNPSRSKGLCEKHYRVMRLSRAPQCGHEGCGNKAVARNLCRKHYQQQYRELSQ